MHTIREEHDVMNYFAKLRRRGSFIFRTPNNAKTIKGVILIGKVGRHIHHIHMQDRSENHPM